MKNNKNNKTKLLAILCILLSIGLISTAFAYIQDTTGKVENTFIASGGGELFDKDNPDESKRGVFTLDESKAVIDTNGVYSLNTNERVIGNDYKLIPGVNVLKDPTITIKNKTEVPAYLYLEVVGDCSDYFDYTLISNWVYLDGALGQHGGSVYVFKENDSILLGEIPDKTIKIIEGDKLFVKSSFTSSNQKSLTFYAYMAQTGVGSETETYNTCFPRAVS